MSPGTLFSMPNWRPIPGKEVEEMVRRYRALEPLESIARSLSRNLQKVRVLLVEAGIRIRPVGRRLARDLRLAGDAAVIRRAARAYESRRRFRTNAMKNGGTKQGLFVHSADADETDAMKKEVDGRVIYCRPASTADGALEGAESCLCSRANISAFRNAILPHPGE